MSTKTNLKTKVAAGTVLVALSGFVPQPLMQKAEAATAAIVVNGSFISGVSLNAGNALDFGTLIATQTTGTAVVDVTAGTLVSSSNLVDVGAAQQAGSFNYTLAATGSLRLSITTGIGAIAGPAPGTVNLNRVDLQSASVNGGNTFNFAATGVTQVQSFTTTAASVLNVGGRIAWAGGRPIGAFAGNTIGLFMAF